MNYKTHNEEPIDINGTHLQVRIKADYTELTALFGLPEERTGFTYKIDWSWSIKFDDGTIATIYNWKSGPNYGHNDVTARDITIWNVGGHSMDAGSLVNKVLGVFQRDDRIMSYTSFPESKTGKSKLLSIVSIDKSYDMTYYELYRAILEMLPRATMDEDNDGQLIIYTDCWVDRRKSCYRHRQLTPHNPYEE